MGNYITIAQAEQALDRIINIYQDSGVVDETHLNTVIGEAEGMINSAIGSRYDIPPTDSEALAFLRGLVTPILRFKSYTAFNESEDVPKGVVEEYKATMKILDQLAKQVISLPNTSDKTTGRASHIKVATSTSTLTGF